MRHAAPSIKDRAYTQRAAECVGRLCFGNPRRHKPRYVAPEDARLEPVDGDEHAIAQTVLLGKVDGAPEREAGAPRVLQLLALPTDVYLHQCLRAAHIREDAQVEEAEGRRNPLVGAAQHRAERARSRRALGEHGCWRVSRQVVAVRQEPPKIVAGSAPVVTCAQSPKASIPGAPITRMNWSTASRPRAACACSAWPGMAADVLLTRSSVPIPEGSSGVWGEHDPHVGQQPAVESRHVLLDVVAQLAAQFDAGWASANHHKRKQLRQPRLAQPGQRGALERGAKFLAEAHRVANLLEE
eukprot:scaffold215359_cov30-Tisochrysis_lutea.AAC.2